MLDSEPQEAVVEDPKVEAPEEAEAPEAAEPEEVVITIEGEEPEVDEADDPEVEAELGDRGKRALKAAREAAKEASRKLREAEARAAALEAAHKPAEPEIKRPSLEECGFNEDVFAEKMTAYVAAQAKVKEQQAEEEARAKAAQDAYKAKLDRYNAERGKVGVDDDVQARVVAALSPPQQTALMDAGRDPAKLVAALAKTPKVLAELAGIKEIHKFTYRLAEIEGKIQMTTKTPPPPETKLRGGTGAASVLTVADLEKMRVKAEETGDYSDYFRAKASAKAVGA
jgi:multidrug efflux pump subunit AcrA (membrane-fusion protein)